MQNGHSFTTGPAFSFPTIVLLICALMASELHAKKDPVPLTDSFRVSPGQSPNIIFDTRLSGYMNQMDDTTWVFHPAGELREARSFALSLKSTPYTAPLKLNDCVYFSPTTQACVNVDAGPFINAHFFISRSDHSQSRSNVPASIRFYVDTARIWPAMYNYLATDTFPESIIAEYLRPFYFRKYEVTNKEYREFTNWVVDSIARTRLGYFLPNGVLDRKKKYDFYDKETKAKINLGFSGRPNYLRGHIDPKKIAYRFKDKPSEFQSDTLSVYPDSTLWTRDFLFSFNDPMEMMYNWHPAYDDYPVAGVSYWQCLAFLEWKSMMLSQQFSGKGQKYKITCMLPSEIEWDYASTAELYKHEVMLIGGHYIGLCDDSWLTDLQLTRASTVQIKIYNEKDIPMEDTVPDQVLSLGRPKREVRALGSMDDQFDYPMRRFSLEQEKTWGDFIYDGYFHTGPAKILPNGFNEEKPESSMRQKNERSSAHYDTPSGICWMDGNVSEWLREDLDRNWRGIFLQHCTVPNGPYAEEQNQIVEYEKYCYDQLPKHGKLVRGSNWFDERFAMKYGKNVGGLQAKTFCDPDKAHCTLGFRYVIYVEAVK